MTFYLALCTLDTPVQSVGDVLALASASLGGTGGTDFTPTVLTLPGCWVY